MKEVENVVKLEEILNHHLFFYRYDIIKVTNHILEMKNHYGEILKKCSIHEMENYAKFLETLFLYIDITFLKGEYILLALKENSSPTPCYERILTVLTLFEENLVDLSKILHFDCTITKASQSKLVIKKEHESFFKKYNMVVPDMHLLLEEMLIELAYKHIVVLVKKHVLDFKKGNVKLFRKVLAVKEINEKQELMQIALEQGTDKESLKIFQNSTTVTYDFENHTDGSYWRNVYNQLLLWAENK